MKRTVCVTIVAALGLAAFHTRAQIPAGLDISMCARLSITGSVGTVYAIQYVTDLAQTNDPAAWRCLEFLQLPATPHVWADKATPVTGRRFYRAVVFPAPTNMVFIPPGTFRMGSMSNEVGSLETERPQTEVMISRGFWMGKYEVTQGEFLDLMGYNRSYFTGDSNRPVEMLTWHDATNYCGKLTSRERTAGRISANSAYRLPTEAEWEYACRALTSTAFSYGEDADYLSLTNYAWYVTNSGSMTHPVGQRLPNAWGLYDMQGNLWEWCQDWWSEHLPGGTEVDPQGPASGIYRAVRGGYWGSVAARCRSATRFNTAPDAGFNMIGFRTVLAASEP